MYMEKSVRARQRPRIADKYEFTDKDKVGEGTYGEVYRASHVDKTKPEKVVRIMSDEEGRDTVLLCCAPRWLTPAKAVKKIKQTKEGEGISLTACREITLLCELRHENIINLLDIYLNPADKSLYLVFDYAEHDLFEIIKWHREKDVRISDFTVKSMLWQLLNGINYLHANWVVHRDLKPSNILVMGEGIVKIGDFGLARIFQSPLRPLSDNGVVVTIWYRGPELLLGARHYTKAVDMWAIGCIFAELLTTRPLFPGKENPHSHFQEEQVDKIFKILGKPTPAQWPSLIQMPEWKTVAGWHAYPNVLQKTLGAVGGNALNLLRSMLDYDPIKRITAVDSMEHHYFKESPLPSMLAFMGTPYKYPARQPIEDKKPEPQPAKRQKKAAEKR